MTRIKRENIQNILNIILNDKLNGVWYRQYKSIFGWKYSNYFAYRKWHIDFFLLCSILDIL